MLSVWVWLSTQTYRADGGDYGGRYGATAGAWHGDADCRHKFDKSQREGGKRRWFWVCASLPKGDSIRRT